MAFQINTAVGIADNSTDLVSALEATLANLAIDIAQSSAGEETLLRIEQIVDMAFGDITPNQSVLLRDGQNADVATEIAAPQAVQV